MRGVQTVQYLYLFNPWSNGKRTMATATNGTATWKRMLALAPKNETIRKRVDVMRYRSVEDGLCKLLDARCERRRARNHSLELTAEDGLNL